MPSTTSLREVGGGKWGGDGSGLTWFANYGSAAAAAADKAASCRQESRRLSG